MQNQNFQLQKLQQLCVSYNEKISRSHLQRSYQLRNNLGDFIFNKHILMQIRIQQNITIPQIIKISIQMHQAQTTKPEEMCFQENTDTFRLTVVLEDTKLTVVLKDYIDWTIYSKEYTEDDIGKDIHRKMELFDVYSAFAQTRQKCDTENLQANSQIPSSSLKKYQFGTVIQTGKHPCYKIQKQGKITAYLKIINAINKEEVIYKSILSLLKIRNMNETEISAEKLARKKQQIQEEFRRRMEKQAEENLQFRRKIDGLEQENRKLKEEITQVKEELKLTRKEIEEKIKETKKELLDQFFSINTTKERTPQQKKQQVSIEMNQIKQMMLKMLQEQKFEENAKNNQTPNQTKPRNLEDISFEPASNKKLIKINQIEPGAQNIRFIAKVLTCTPITTKAGDFVRCLLGDETSVVDAYLKKSEHIVIGKTVILSNAWAKVFFQHIQIQRAYVEPALKQIDYVNEKLNISNKQWIPILD